MEKFKYICSKRVNSKIMNGIKTRLRPLGIYKENVRSYYIVRYKDEEEHVRMLPYQMTPGRELPKELNCLVVGQGASRRILQDFTYNVREIYEVGGVYPFVIKDRMSSYYSVLDPNGFIFWITEFSDKTLASGQSVRARVLSIDGVRIRLALVEDRKEAPRIKFVDFARLRKDLDAGGDDVDRLEKMVNADPSMSDVLSLYQDGNGLWLLRTVEHLDALLLGGAGREGRDYVSVFRSLCIYILEESDILKDLDADERTSWIRRLTLITQHAEDYRTAYAIMDGGDARGYISQQLDRLRESEYLYQPERRFRVMMCILNLDEGLMAEMMDRFFDIILQGNKAHWQAEPFRTAFVNLLEIFISENRQKAVRSKSGALIEKMVRAIAIQQLLSTNDDDIDRRLNRATYFRLLSYRHRSNAVEILGHAFTSLFIPFDGKLEYDWKDVRSLDSLYFDAAYNTRRHTLNNASAYHGDHLTMAVDSSGVTIRPDEGRPEPVSLNNLVSWQNLRILSGNAPKYKLKNTGRVETVRRYWREVIEALWKKAPVRRAVRITPSKGDIVPIRVIDINDQGSALYCEVVDERYEGKGWLPMQDTVSYLQADKDNLGLFRDDSGEPYVFEAEVVDDGEDLLKFSLRRTVSDYFDVNYDTGTRVDCTVRATCVDRDLGPCYVGITADGASCLVVREKGLVLTEGSYVEATVRCGTERGQYICDYTAPSGNRFYITEAFRRLLSNLQVLPEQDAEEQVAEEPVSRDSMAEVIGILDRLSAIDDSRVHAYSYLCVAEILCRMMDDGVAVDYYRKRQSLVAAFEEYETNGYVDGGRLSALIASIGEDLVENDFLVNDSITKFRILDALKHRENVDRLFAIREKAISPSVQNAADLAVSLLLTERFELPNVERQLLDRINTEIGVTVRTSKLRDWGIETQSVEFKSSIVYPAGQKHMLPSPAMQGAVIMQTICGFLNSDEGGTLYLGINKSGGACGVDGDLTYLGTDQDGYGRYLHNMVNRELGTIANQCCTDSEWIDDGGYQIYAVHIRPCPDLVAFRGQYWIRQDTEKRILGSDDVARYREMHERAYAKYAEGHPETQEAEAPATAEVPAAVPVDTIGEKEVSSSSERILTSAWRPNVTDPWNEDSLVETAAFIHFLPNWKFKVTDEGIYDPTELSLAVKTREADGYLAIAYRSGNILAVGMQEILDKTRNRKNARCQNEEPLFACPAAKDDEVMTVWKNTQGELLARVDGLDELKTHHCFGSMTDSGAIVHDTKFDSLVACEIVPAEKLRMFQKYRNSGTRLGQKLRSPDLHLIREQLQLDIRG